MSNAVEKLTALLRDVGAKPTLDPGRSITHHCTFCDAPGPHDLRTIGVYPNGEDLTRPVCTRCMPLVDAMTTAGESALSREKARADEEAAGAAAMRDWCAAWLRRAVAALFREGWEPGMTEREATDALVDVLANLGCDDGTGERAQVVEAARLDALPISHAPPSSGRALLAERDRLREAVRRIRDGGMSYPDRLPPKCDWCGRVMRPGQPMHDSDCPAAIARTALAAGIDDAKGGG